MAVVLTLRRMTGTRPTSRDRTTRPTATPPHPSSSDLAEPLDIPTRVPTEPWRDDDENQTGHARHAGQAGQVMDVFSRRLLAGKLAEIKQAAYTTGIGAGSRRGPGKIIAYVHLTDQNLTTGQGVMRVEQHGPMLASRLSELLGHNQIVVKPVIDLNDHISVDAYEIPDRIRERIKLIHPVEQFVYGTAETTMRTDLDHTVAYNPTGPPGQTSTTNLAPLARFSHRLKTHGDWTVRRLHDGTFEWISPHKFKFRVDHTGTHPHRTDPTDLWRWPLPNPVTPADHTNQSADSDDSPGSDDTAV
jgi:hypothetical protein